MLDRDGRETNNFVIFSKESDDTFVIIIGDLMRSWELVERRDINMRCDRVDEIF